MMMYSGLAIRTVAIRRTSSAQGVAGVMFGSDSRSRNANMCGVAPPLRMSATTAPA